MSNNTISTMQNTVELENVAQTLFGKILKFVYVIKLF